MKHPKHVALFIDPPSHHFLQNRLFDFKNSYASASGDEYHRIYTHLRDFLESMGIPVQTADYLPEREVEGVLNLYVSMGVQRDFRQLSRRRDVVLSAFFASECPIVEPSLYRSLTRVEKHFKRVFSWSDSHSLGRFLISDVALQSYRIPQAFHDVHERIWGNTDRCFLVMINKNKLAKVSWQELYTARLKAVEFFSRTDEIDLYGIGWDRSPMLLGESWVPWTVRLMQDALRHQWQRLRPDPLLAACRRAYRGPADSKAETLGQYRFAICFENMVLKGYITEKIFDCFFAGTVPVYWGAADIADVVPSNCFIDMRRFKDYTELRDHLHALSEDDILQYKLRARQFLASAGFRPFSKQAFAEKFLRIVKEDTGIGFLQSDDRLYLGDSAAFRHVPEV